MEAKLEILVVATVEGLGLGCTSPAFIIMLSVPCPHNSYQCKRVNARLDLKKRFTSAAVQFH